VSSADHRTTNHKNRRRDSSNEARRHIRIAVVLGTRISNESGIEGDCR